MSNKRMQQCTGIVVLAAGLGWAGSNFTPADAPWWNYLLHTIPFLILLVLSLGFFRAADASRHGNRGGWANTGLNIFAAITAIVIIAGIVMGAINPDPNGYGISTVGDFVPAILVLLGGLVWLTTLLPTHKGKTEAEMASNR